ncbi:type II CAAX endopeptidase family protein [uncultured Thioclava sp.]|uniref:CPBP family intramembrane glutamic endopeptidase n=1 Tax=uncultured Thioclava sp. TaxID=473858 RepID=UPI0025E52A66|nr:type II CAAX endopeptidase family protein [uncultured Thioclava sp.]
MTAPARHDCAFWRTVLGAIMIVAIYVGAGWLLLLVMTQSVPSLRLVGLLSEIATGSSPRGLVILLASFAPLLLGTLFVARWWHGRAAGSLFGPNVLRDLRAVLPWLLIVSLLCTTLALFDSDVGRSTRLGTSLRWVGLALPLLAVQITAEEVLFRGYLLAQLGARWRSRWMWMVLPSALFGALHYDPGSFGPNAIWLAIWAFAFGCFAADLTARTGNIGAALALHLVNNFTSMFIVGFYGDLDGLALYTIVINARDFAILAPWLAIDALMIFIGWLMIRLILRV